MKFIVQLIFPVLLTFVDLQLDYREPLYFSQPFSFFVYFDESFSTFSFVGSTAK